MKQMSIEAIMKEFDKRYPTDEVFDNPLTAIEARGFLKCVAIAFPEHKETANEMSTMLLVQATKMILED